MSGNTFDPLIEEYKQVSPYVNSSFFDALKVIPVLLTAITAVAVYSKELPPLFGPGVSLAIFTMLIWVGYCHSIINGVGLRLVDIEQRINKASHFDRLNGLSYHTLGIGQGMKYLHGYPGYTIALVFVFSTVLIGSLAHFWFVMTKWGWCTTAKTASVLGLGILDYIPLGIMAWSEMRARRCKQEIISRYRSD